MKIHIAQKDLHSFSAVRGIGVYTRELLRALHKHYPADEISLGELSHANPPDVIHYPYFDPFAHTLRPSGKIPFVLTIHDLIPLRFKDHFPAGIRGKIAWIQQQRAARQARHIITDSHASKADIIKFLDITPDHITVIPLGPNHTAAVNKKLAAKIAGEYNLPPKYILYVGDINWNKNVIGLIKAFDTLKDKHIHLVLVGKVFGDQPNIPEYHQIQQAIKLSHKPSQIMRIGFVPTHHLSVLYAKATLYVQPSWYEGFGLPILEAMKFGCPVLSSNKGSLPEVGGDAVEYCDPSDLSRALIGLLKKPSRLKQLKEQGIQRAKLFTWGKVALATHQVYEQAQI